MAGCGQPAATLDPTGVAPIATAVTTTAVSPTAAPLPETTATVPTAAPSPETATAVPTAAPPTAVATATPVPAPTEPPIETYIAYVQDDQLRVSHIIAGQVIDTQPYFDSLFRGGILQVGWSPSGRYLALMARTDDSFDHVFVIDIEEGGAPVDLGIATQWAWSPDSSLIAFEHEYEVWVHSLADGRSRPLTIHIGSDWLWGRMAFAPAGDAVIAAGTARKEMGMRGITLYRLYRVPLDGSATGAYPPAGLTAASEEVRGALPLDLRFSPDGQKLAVNTWSYVDGCATLGEYHVANGDGGDWRDLTLASLAAAGGPEQDMYFYGDSLVWSPDSESLWVNGLVNDCGQTFDLFAGPQLSRVSLDGVEHEIFPGPYAQMSLDRSGMLLGVVRDEYAGKRVQILGTDGRLVLDLGLGDRPAMRP